jgi:homoserine dehydrogenase
MERIELNIGLFGFGCVGYGLYKVLAQTPSINAHIQHICVKNRNKPRQIDAHNFVFDKDIILNDDSINVVVELIDDADEAFAIVKTALQKGKAVVSANKKMIAEHFEELQILQQKHKVPLLYEGAVCASIPIIRNLEEYYNNDLLESLEGIVNGSTNYILTKTVTENLSYADALQQAQANGYAESNPILDTGGYDAKYKLLILLAHAFGLVLKPEDIFNIGINHINNWQLKYAKENGYKIKLVAQAFKTSHDTICAFVAPKFVAPNEKLYQVDDVFNGVVLQTAFTESQFFVGKGAGAYPTASAVLSDISALGYNYQYEYHKIRHNNSSHASATAVNLSVLLSAKVDELNAIKSYVACIKETFINQTLGYVIGEMDLASLQLITSEFACSAIVFEVLDNETTDMLASKKESACIA